MRSFARVAYARLTTVNDSGSDDDDDTGIIYQGMPSSDD